ncbi:MAG: phytanoyl-CoA dioxygenase family protein [Deltaproteobacteria bacterium]|nr:phytanoyl-CoA dioxygenase family protein [Deltaproteobacteria bacterium]
MTAASTSLEPWVTPAATALRAQGFVVLEQFVPRIALVRMSSLVRSMLVDRLGPAMAPMMHGGDEGRDTPPGKDLVLWMKLRPQEQAIAALSPLVRRARCIAAVALEAEPDAVEIGGRLFHKPARVGGRTPWHQDDAYDDPSSPRRRMTMWIPLVDVSPTSGCMLFVPNSHHGRLRPHQAGQGGRRLALSTTLDPADTTCAVPMEAGDVSLHLGRTLHASGANASPQPRPALALVCTVPSQAVGEQRPTAGGVEAGLRDTTDNLSLGSGRTPHAIAGSHNEDADR